MRIRPLFRLSLALILLGCNTDQSPPQPAPEPVEISILSKANYPYEDSIITETAHELENYGKQTSDTSFRMNGKMYTLRISGELLMHDTVCKQDKYIQKRKLYRNTYCGADARYTFELLDQQKRTLWKKQLTKRDYFKAFGSLVAESNIYLPQFVCFYAPTQQIVLTQEFWVPDSDVGIEGALLITPQGEITQLYNRWFGGSGEECEVQPAPDGNCLLTCSKMILRSGQEVSLLQDFGSGIGNMFIGKSSIFVVSSVDKQHSTQSGRIFSTSGKLIKEFAFEGYSGGLNYSLPYHYFPEPGKYYFVDEQNKRVVVLNEKEIQKVELIPFSKVRVQPDPEHHMLIKVSHETIEFQLAVDREGKVHSLQTLEGEDWKFYDELER